MMKQKYPRSWHLSYSEKSSSDDKRHDNEDHFEGEDVVVTIKMDGENTTIYNDYCHARSVDSKSDSEDRRWIDALRVSKIEGNLPKGYRICGENLFYKHTCYYDNLKSMFYVFSIWDGETCLSWDETKLWCGIIGIETVPVIYEGIYNKDSIKESFLEYEKKQNTEGFVIRKSDSFKMSEFHLSLSKFVKKGFEIPSQHWRYSAKTKNKISGNKNPWTII